MPPQKLSLRDLNRATLSRQGLLDPLPDAPAAVLVERIGSLQSQHPDWPPFALQARRAPGKQPVDLLAARQQRALVRAPLMRITVHVISARDFWPMSTLTRPFRVDQWRLMFKADPQGSPLGRRITAAHGAVLERMRDAPMTIRDIEATLSGELAADGVPGNRALWRHFSAAVPLVLVPFDGEGYGRARYVSAEQWLGPASDDDRDPDRAAEHVAVRYLAAFGPASAEDLAAYVGRGKGIRQWRRALERLRTRLVELTDEEGRPLVDLADGPRPGADRPSRPRLLARWDSLLLAYGTRDRARVLPPEHQATVITRNADVLPTFLVDGMVAGTWLPRHGAHGPTIEVRPFGRLSPDDHDAIEAEAARLLPVLARGAFGRYPGTG